MSVYKAVVPGEREGEQRRKFYTALADLSTSAAETTDTEEDAEVVTTDGQHNNTGRA